MERSDDEEHLDGGDEDQVERELDWHGIAEHGGWMQASGPKRGGYLLKRRYCYYFFYLQRKFQVKQSHQIHF